MFHKQHCLLKLLKSQDSESSLTHPFSAAASQPPSHPQIPEVPDKTRRTSCDSACPKRPRGWGNPVEGPSAGKGGLPTGRAADHTSGVFRETSSHLQTSAPVCNIFSPGFYSKLTKDAVTYLAIIEQTSVRFLPLSHVSLNRKYASTLIVSDRPWNSPAGSVGNTTPHSGGFSPTS